MRLFVDYPCKNKLSVNYNVCILEKMYTLVATYINDFSDIVFVYNPVFGFLVNSYYPLIKGSIRPIVYTEWSGNERSRTQSFKT